MASLSSVKSVWDNLTEVDLEPLRAEALKDVNIALIGEPDSGRGALAHQMRRDPSHPKMISQTPILILQPSEVDQLVKVDLAIITVDASRAHSQIERETADNLLNRGLKVLVFINHYAEIISPAELDPWLGWDSRAIIYGAVSNLSTLQESFVPAVVAMLPDSLPALARAFPLFRTAVAHKLINETCISNAAYSFSTGLAEMVPVLGIPLTVADIFVLTKMQAFLVYKLGLALGLSSQWQDYVVEFGGVLGGGFLWRQAARSLVGLIPLYGIIPKVAIAYAGTYVVGHVVLRWYLTGKHLTKEEMGALFREALERGKTVAKRIPSRKQKMVPASEEQKTSKRFRLRLPGRRQKEHQESDEKRD